MNGSLIKIEKFRDLSLRVGTLSKVEPVLGDLAVATVHLGMKDPVEALAPAAALPSGEGVRVVVAVGLHPLAVPGRRFTACLVTVEGSAPVIAAEIPDGSPLS